MIPLSKEELETRSNETLVRYALTLQTELASLYETVTRTNEVIGALPVGKEQAE